jgi:hypothetical protein
VDCPHGRRPCWRWASVFCRGKPADAASARSDAAHAAACSSSIGRIGIAGFADKMFLECSISLRFCEVRAVFLETQSPRLIQWHRVGLGGRRRREVPGGMVQHCTICLEALPGGAAHGSRTSSRGPLSRRRRPRPCVAEEASSSPGHAAAAGYRPAVSLGCGHTFHLDCIGNTFNALQQEPARCPLCRAPQPFEWRGAAYFRAVAQEEQAEEARQLLRVEELGGEARGAGAVMAGLSPAHQPVEWDDACSLCAAGGELLCCDGCPRTLHARCAGLTAVPEGDWRCPWCLLALAGGASSSARGGSSQRPRSRRRRRRLDDDGAAAAAAAGDGANSHLSPQQLPLSQRREAISPSSPFVSQEPRRLATFDPGETADGGGDSCGRGRGRRRLSLRRRRVRRAPSPESVSCTFSSPGPLGIHWEPRSWCVR